MAFTCRSRCPSPTGRGAEGRGPACHSNAVRSSLLPAFAPEGAKDMFMPDQEIAA